MTFILQLLFILLTTHVYSELISSSSLEKCYSKAANETMQNCGEKMVVALSIENNQNTPTEQLQAQINKVINTSSHTPVTLQEPITIKVTKSPVYAVYPLVYQQDFNDQPKERIQYTTILGCEDGAYSSNPTCGFQYDSEGKSIFDSQGYCCSCTFSQIVGLDKDELTRGNICKTFNLGVGAATAHCLEFSDLWYSAFNILDYQIVYNITIKVSYSGNKTHSDVLVLGDQSLVASNKDKSVIARIIGPLKELEDFSNYFLLEPSSPKTNIRVQEGASMWMLIEKEYFTLSGLECNKIGAGYSAFRNEPDKCNNPIGSCLQHQIEEFYQQDLKRIQQGKKPEYLLASKGDYMEVKYENQVSLGLQVDSNMATLVTLELNAKKLKFIVNLGIGKITYAFVYNFTAMSQDGQLVVQITNTGDISSEFVCEFICSQGVLDLEARTIFIVANKSSQLKIPIYTESTAKANYSCQILLENNVGSLLDNYTVYFSASAMQQVTNQNGTTTKAEQQEQPTPDTDICDTECDGIKGIPCAFRNKCWSELISSLAKISSALALICFLITCYKKGRPIIRCLCCLNKSKKKETSQPKKIPQRENISELTELSFQTPQKPKRAIGHHPEYIDNSGDISRNSEIRLNKKLSFISTGKNLAEEFEAYAEPENEGQRKEFNIFERCDTPHQKFYFNISVGDDIQKLFVQKRSFSVAVQVKVERQEDGAFMTKIEVPEDSPLNLLVLINIVIFGIILIVG